MSEDAGNEIGDRIVQARVRAARVEYRQAVHRALRKYRLAYLLGGRIRQEARARTRLWRSAGPDYPADLLARHERTKTALKRAETMQEKTP